jgi:hypothetical protein
MIEGVRGSEPDGQTKNFEVLFFDIGTNLVPGYGCGPRGGMA